MEPTMDAVSGYDAVDALVRRIFFVEDLTYGTEKQEYILRYRGRLAESDSVAAYDRLAAGLAPLGYIPLFRNEEGRHAILIVNKPPAPQASNPRVNLVLFILTAASVLVSGAMYGMDQTLPQGFWAAAGALIARGWPFAVALIAILGAHELGHYFAGRRHGVHVTLPYFIPLPFSPFGTMGAFINMKEVPKNKRVLLDIGISGPLAGLAVTLPVLLLGLSLSRLEPLPGPEAALVGGTLEGNSILYLGMKYLVFGQLLPAPASTGDLPAVLYWLRYFFTGTPLPLGGLDVMLHPVAWAGWAGLLVTSLNLIPAGQLDGGHVMYVLFGKQRLRRWLPFVLAALVILGFFWTGWYLWAAIIFFLGRAYAEPLDQITELDPARRRLAIFVLVLFFLIFIPVPLVIF